MPKRDPGWASVPMTLGSMRDPDYDYGDKPSSVAPEIEFNEKAFSMPFDPVVRMALIDKGILTPEDLKAAEEKIRMTSGEFNRQVAQNG